MGIAPAHEIVVLMPNQVVQHNQQAQGRRRDRPHQRDLQPGFPALPKLTAFGSWQIRRCRQASEYRLELGFKPGKQNLIGTSHDTLKCPVPERFEMVLPHPRTRDRGRAWRLAYSQPQSSFFCVGIWVCDFVRPIFANPDDFAGLTPGAVSLPGIASIVQHGQDGEGRHFWQTIRCSAQAMLQGGERPCCCSITFTVGRASKLAQDALALRCTVLNCWPSTVAQFERGEPIVIEATNEVRHRIVGAPTDGVGSLQVVHSVGDGQQQLRACHLHCRCVLCATDLLQCSSLVISQLPQRVFLAPAHCSPPEPVAQTTAQEQAYARALHKARAMTSDPLVG